MVIGQLYDTVVRSLLLYIFKLKLYIVEKQVYTEFKPFL